MNRRDMLTAAPTFAFASLMATGARAVSPRATPAYVDPHVAWLEEARHTTRAWLDLIEKHDVETAQSLAMWDRHLLARDNILYTPAKTIEGMAAQLAWIVEETGTDFHHTGHNEALALVLAGLNGIAA